MSKELELFNLCIDRSKETLGEHAGYDVGLVAECSYNCNSNIDGHGGFRIVDIETESYNSVTDEWTIDDETKLMFYPESPSDYSIDPETCGWKEITIDEAIKLLKA